MTPSNTGRQGASGQDVGLQPAHISAANLSDEQRAIVVDRTRSLLVEAGAGTGKTTVLVSKILHELGLLPMAGQVATAPLSPDAVGAITFTRRAAAELRDRVRSAVLRMAASADGIERERLVQLAFELEQIAIGTIDSFAARILRDFGALAGVESGFDVLEPSDADDLYADVADGAITAAVRAQDAGALFLVRHFGFVRTRDILVDLCGRGTMLRDLARKAEAGHLTWAQTVQTGIQLTATDVLLEPAARAVLAFTAGVYDAVCARMRANGVLDHALVVQAAADLAADPYVCAAFRAQTRLLFVDEHQDTDLAQARLVFRLTGTTDAARAKQQRAHAVGQAKDRTSDVASIATPTRLILIGDPKQSIYGFRNADASIWTASRTRITQAGGACHQLTENYRSRPALHQFYDHFLSRVMGDDARARGRPYDVAYRALTPSRPHTPGPAVELLLPDNGTRADGAAPLVAARIRHMLDHPHGYPVWERHPDGTERMRGLRARDIAILARQLAGGAAEAYEQALRAEGIRAYVYGGRGLYARQEVQDLAALLRTVADPDDAFALTAVLRSPFGGVDDATLASLSAALDGAPGPRRRAGETLWDVLGRAERVVRDRRALRAVVTIRDLVAGLIALRDRLPHDELLELAMERTHYRAFLAGAPDAPAGIRNVAKLLRIMRAADNEPLARFVERLAARVRRAEPEEEAPLYTPDDDLVVISTIHKSKGLEWPVVVLTGIDDPLVRTAHAPGPALHPDFGIVLPTDLVLRDERSEVPVLDRSGTWAHHETTRVAKEYAEAKRILYVACTRARDHLLLAGALRQPWRPKHEDPDSQYLTSSGVEFWLRHSYPGLAKRADTLPLATQMGRADGSAGSETAANTIASVRVIRGLTAARGEDSARDSAGTRADVRAWPIVDADPVRREARADHQQQLDMPPAVRERTARVDHRSLMRTEFTVSELMTFAACDWKHYYGYVESVSTTQLEAVPDTVLVDRIEPAELGTILHDYLRGHDRTWTDIEQRAAMRCALTRHRPMADEVLEQNTGVLLEHARHYLTHPWAERVERARRRAHELPFVLQLSASVRLRGTFDILVEEEDGWRLLDFKTGLYDVPKAQLGPILDRAVQQYEMQAAVYALAARAAHARASIREFVFFFTSCGEARVVQTDDAWLDRWRDRLGLTVSALRQAVRGRTRNDPRPAIWDGKRCHGCEYIDLCLPSNRPNDQ